LLASQFKFACAAEKVVRPWPDRPDRRLRPWGTDTQQGVHRELTKPALYITTSPITCIKIYCWPIALLRVNRGLFTHRNSRHSLCIMTCQCAGQASVDIERRSGPGWLRASALHTVQ